MVGEDFEQGGMRIGIRVWVGEVVGTVTGYGNERDGYCRLFAGSFVLSERCYSYPLRIIEGNLYLTPPQRERCQRRRR